MRHWAPKGQRIGNASPARATATSRDRTEAYQLRYDPASGITHTVVHGYWSVADANAYFERIQFYVEIARRTLGSARVLVDRRGCPVQSPGVAKRMEQASRDLLHQGDALAIIVDSQLVRLQLQRVFHHERSKVVLSPEEALAWLEREL